MFDRQFYLNNSYSPGRFMIKLDWEQDLTEGCTPLLFETKGKESLFIHEYIHFLQEISTAYGRMKTSCMLMGSLQRSHQIRQSTNTEFKVPIEIDKNLCDEVIYFNEKVSTWYAGTSFTSELRNVQIKIKSLTPISISIQGKNLNYLNSTIETPNGKNIEIIIGGEILCESMAYLAEKNFMDVNFLKCGLNDPFPYRMVNLMAEKLYPEIANNDLLLYKIIDLCLSKAYNPGITIYNFFKILQKEEYHKDISNDRLISLFNAQLHQSHNLCLIGDEVIREIKQCFQGEYYATTINWLQELYHRSDFIRLCDPIFMKEFFTTEGISEYAYQFIDKVFGYPYIINEMFEGIWRPPYNFSSNLRQNVEFHLLAGALEIGHILKSFDKCRLKKFCKVSPDSCMPNIIDDICNHPCDKLAALKNSTIKRLCPFAAIWKHWGLDGKHISQ